MTLISSVLRPQSACPRTCSTLYSHDSTLSGIAALVCAIVAVVVVVVVVVAGGGCGGCGGDVLSVFMLVLLPSSVLTSRHVLAARPRQSNGSCRSHLPLLREESVWYTLLSIEYICLAALRIFPPGLCARPLAGVCM